MPRTTMFNIKKAYLGPSTPMKGQHAWIIPKANGFPCSILANDPSFTAWGWAIIDYKGIVIKTGCIKTKTEGKKRRIRKGDETVQRTGEILQVLLRLIKEFNVQFIVTELPHGSQNASGAVMIGITIGILKTLSDTLDIGIEWYSEGDSKKCLLGKISASKQKTIDAIKKLYKIPWTGKKYIDEAVADALSIHYCATKQSATLKMMKI